MALQHTHPDRVAVLVFLTVEREVSYEWFMMRCAVT